MHVSSRQLSCESTNIYIHTRIHNIHTYTYDDIHTYLHTYYICVRTYMCMHITYMHTCQYKNIRIHTYIRLVDAHFFWLSNSRVNLHTHIWTSIYIYAYAHIQWHTYIHTYKHTIRLMYAYVHKKYVNICIHIYIQNNSYMYTYTHRSA